jgi:hypothetical protein
MRGIYLDTPAAGLGVVADLNTAIPGGTGNFTDFDYPSLEGASVAFKAYGSGQKGVYSDVGGSLGVVADLNTPIPDGTGNFTDFGYIVSLDGGNVAFQAEGASGQKGIYTNVGRSLNKVIDLSDSLDGKTIWWLYMGPEALSGNSVAFLAAFTDNSSGVFTATVVPEPSALALAALGLLGLALCGRGRKR